MLCTSNRHRLNSRVGFSICLLSFDYILLAHQGYEIGIDGLLVCWTLGVVHGGLLDE